MPAAKELDHAFNAALRVVKFKGGFDSFAFRKGFEEDDAISPEEKNELLAYLKDKITLQSADYRLVKKKIDDQEFLTTDYYANPYPREFRGAYSPVVLKTFAGIMRLTLNDKPK